MSWYDTTRVHGTTANGTARDEMSRHGKWLGKLTARHNTPNGTTREETAQTARQDTTMSRNGTERNETKQSKKK